jgi:hypothetical protein
VRFSGSTDTYCRSARRASYSAFSICSCHVLSAAAISPRLEGHVRRIFQKGAFTREELIREIRRLVPHDPGEGTAAAS